MTSKVHNMEVFLTYYGGTRDHAVRLVDKENGAGAEGSSWQAVPSEL